MYEGFYKFFRSIKTDAKICWRLQSLLRLLGSLCPQLHQQEDQTVTRQYKDNADASIPPAVVIIEKIDAVQVVRSAAIDTDPAISGCIRVDEVVPRTWSSKVFGQVRSARVASGRIETCKFRVFAIHRLFKVCEDEKSSNHVVEGVASSIVST